MLFIVCDGKLREFTKEDRGMEILKDREESMLNAIKILRPESITSAKVAKNYITDIISWWPFEMAHRCVWKFLINLREDIKDNVEFANYVLAESGSFYVFLGENIKNDRNIIIKALYGGCEFLNIPCDMQDDDELIDLAINHIQYETKDYLQDEKDRYISLSLIGIGVDSRKSTKYKERLRALRSGDEKCPKK